MPRPQKAVRAFLTDFRTLFGLGLVVWWAVLRSPLFYIDDVVRVYSHRLIDEGLHGRLLTDIFIRFFYDGVFTDASPLTQVIALACLACAGVIAHRAFFGRRKGYTVLLASPLLVFPYYPAFLSFRFDAPFMALALLLCVAPFAMERKKGHVFFGFGTVCLLCSLMLYQVFYGVYATVACFLLLFAAARGHTPRRVLRRAGKYLAPMLASCLCYLPIYVLARKSMRGHTQGIEGTLSYVGHHSTLPPYTELFATLATNIKIYFLSIYNHWSAGLPTTLLALALLLLLLAAGKSLVGRMSGAAFPGRAASLGGAAVPVGVLLILVLLALASIAPYGLQLLLRNPTWHIRTFCGTGAFAACLLLAAGALARGRVLPWALAGTVSVYLLWCGLFLSSIGNLQRDQYNHDQLVWRPLLADVEKLAHEQGITSFGSTGETSRTPTAMDLLAKYSFIGELVPKSSLGWCIAALPSSLPVRYIYPLHRDMGALNAGEVLAQRLSYTIRRLGPHAAVIMLHQPQQTTIDILRGGKTLDESFSK